jgi:hypothetical protein
LYELLRATVHAARARLCKPVRDVVAFKYEHLIELLFAQLTSNRRSIVDALVFGQIVSIFA